MSASLLTHSAVALAVVAGACTILWIISLIKRNASIIDPFWGFGFVLVTWVMLAQSHQEHSWATWILVSLVSIWGLRLSVYLTWRSWGSGEDYRYRDMRQSTGSSFWWKSLFKVFWLQAALIVLISAPVQLAIHYGTHGGWWTYLGAGLAVIGLFFETVGDFQLSRFKADPANEGEVMDKGLWRYTRHPNYFGDFLFWWGIYTVCAANGWWTIFGPLIMSFLLLKFSGVALLEKSISSRRPGYADYVKRTNAFFPGPPKSAT